MYMKVYSTVCTHGYMCMYGYMYAFICVFIGIHVYVYVYVYIDITNGNFDQSPSSSGMTLSQIAHLKLNKCGI